MKYFGTDGFRGEAYKDLRVEHVEKIANFISKNFKNIVIAKDSRISSDDFLNIMTNIFAKNNNTVCNLGLFTTPAVSFVVNKIGFDCGIIISASHNPYIDNGIKIVKANGEKMMDDILEDIEYYIDNDKMLENRVYPKGNIDKDLAQKLKDENFNLNMYARNLYIEYLKNTFADGIDKCDLKIAYDCANGSSSNSIKEIIERINYDTKDKSLKIDATYFNNKPNGKNINVDSGSTHIEVFKERLDKKYKEDKKIYDITFSFDGDADRLISMHFNKEKEEYEIIDGDKYMFIVALILKELNRLKNSQIAITTMSNLGLINSLKKMGISASITDVGDRFVYARMKEKDLILGGEQSGHIIFREILQTGDGMLSSLMLLNLLLKYAKMKNISFNEALNSLLKKVVILPQVLKNVRVKDKIAIMNNNILLKEVEVFSKEHIDSRILIRKSGTENLIRVMVESPSKAECNLICDYFVDIVNNINNEL